MGRNGGMKDFDPFDVREDDAPERPEEAGRREAPSGAGAPGAPENRGQAGAGMAAGLLGRLSQHRIGRWIRRFWIPLTAAAAVILILAVFGNAIAVRVAPAWVVGRGAARTADAVESRISASPYQALSMFGSALMAGSLECEFTYFDSYSDGFGQVRLVTDLEHHRLSFGGEAMVNGQHVDGEIFLSDQRAALRSSWLQDCYGLAYDTFEEDLRASALPDVLGLTEEEIRRAGLVMGQMTDRPEIDLRGLADACAELGNSFWKDLEFSSGSAKTSVGGRRTSCTAVTAELSGRALRGLAMDVFDIFAEDEGLRGAAAVAMAAESGCTPEEAGQLLDGRLRSAGKNLENLLRGLDCDLELTCYLYQGRLVRLEAAGEVLADGVPAGLECLLDFGLDPAEDAWSFSCALTNLRGGMISAGAEYQSSADSSSYAGSLRIFVDEGWGAETVVLSSDWDRESGALEVSLDDGDAVRSIQCSLLVDRNRAELNADCFDALLHSRDGYLELRLTADKRDRPEDPDYINLDRWDQAVLRKMEESAPEWLTGF